MSAANTSRIAPFLMCGGAAAAVNWLARVGLSLVMPFTPALVLAYGVGMVVGFLLYKFVVWPTSDLDWRRQAARFVVVNAQGAFVVLLVALALVELGGLFSDRRAVVEALAHGAAIAVGAVANYLGHARFTFARARPA